MQAKIAVATTNGRAYYLLVSELRRRKVPFIVINPTEALSLNIAVAITTASEKHLIDHPTTLVYDAEMDPSDIIEEALRIARGKQRYRSLVIGIDPGKDCGIAAVGDGEVLKTAVVSGEEDAAAEVLSMLKRFESDLKIIKIGSGAEDYRAKLITILDRELLPAVDVESVEEGGTTKGFNIVPHQKRFGDVSSAIKISTRRGRVIKRGSVWKGR